MFPINLQTKDFNEKMLTQFDELLAQENLPWKLKEILPKFWLVGKEAGRLTEEGAD